MELCNTKNNDVVWMEEVAIHTYAHLSRESFHGLRMWKVGEVKGSDDIRKDHKITTLT